MGNGGIINSTGHPNVLPDGISSNQTVSPVSKEEEAACCLRQRGRAGPLSARDDSGQMRGSLCLCLCVKGMMLKRKKGPRQLFSSRL